VSLVLNMSFHDMRNLFNASCHYCPVIERGDCVNALCLRTSGAGLGV
jgi:hypothetical protein